MRLRDALYLVPRLGLGASGFQAVYKLRRRLGLQAAGYPTPPWSAVTLARYGVPTADPAAFLAGRPGARFFFPPGRPVAVAAFLAELPADARARIEADADAVAAGRFRFFSGASHDLGAPPDWNRNALNGERQDPSRHWCAIPDFDPRLGDIKLYWEASRFGWVYALARAYALTGDPRHAETFWDHFGSWCDQNAPNRGPQWKCGQEVALRAMALLFAWHVFADAPASSADRRVRLLAVVGFHAERIEGNLAYAWSLANNHGISEALGLYAAGLLLPELAPAARWRATGERLLQAEAQRQIFDDGSYIQHSLNYHRLMLHNFAWALALAAANGQDLGTDLRTRVTRASRFLAELTDAGSGDVPNYGHNDGALILPLDAGGYRDYRACAQAGHRAAAGTSLWPAGPWDETACWLLGAAREPAAGPAFAPASFDAPVGGYYTLRGAETWALVRCHTYTTRPAHADALHLDLWWRGTNVLIDAGTYHYLADPPWDHAFKGTRAHNTLTLDGRDQMRHVGRFLWSDWTRADADGRPAFAERAVEAWQGVCYAAGGGAHRRAVVRLGEVAWAIVDEVLGADAVAIAACWHLPAAPHERLAPGRLRVDLPPGPVELLVLAPAEAAFDVVSGGADGRGWRSTHYGVKEPALAVEAAWRAVPPTRAVTLVGLGAPLAAAIDGDRVSVRCGGTAYDLTLAGPGTPGWLVRAVERREGL